MDYYYEGAWRMDWGLGNPNKTGTLIACLMIAVWAIAFLWKRGFWPALVIFTALAWCLVQTYSRGGILALLSGLAVLIVSSPRPWPKARWIAVVASIWILGMFVLLAKAQSRYGQGLFAEDQSIGNRLLIWKQVPQMLAAAPWGWGIGKAGDAYTQWFQPPSQSLNYLNLISSHFNFMVETGWLGSILYLFAWFSVFLLCRPVPTSRLKFVPVSIWVAFGVGACFSHVEESPWLWILPVAALIYSIAERIRVARWPESSGYVVGAACSTALISILVLLGFSTEVLTVKNSGESVTIGSGPVSTVIFVDRRVMGSLYGHTVRKFLAANPDILRNNRFIFLESSRDFPAVATHFVISGRFMQDANILSRFDQGQQMILVNPAGFPDEIQPKDWIEKTTVYLGEYSHAPSRSSWSNYPGLKTVQIEGASDFIPSWPETIWSPRKT